MITGGTGSLAMLFLNRFLKTDIKGEIRVFSR